MIKRPTFVPDDESKGRRVTETQEPATVMVVDDTPIIRTCLQESLQGAGYRVRAFSSGAAALEAAVTFPPDLVLLDIHMPEMDGFEVCERLKSDPVLQEIPVLFLSALTEIRDKVKALAVGGVDYVTKPFQFDEVHARVKTHLELNRQRRNLQQSNARLRELDRRLKDHTVQLEAANRELEAFSYSVSHDLRAPLRAINGFARILREDHAAQLDFEGHRILETIASEGSRLGCLIDELLVFSQMGRQPLRRSEIDMEDLVRTICEELVQHEPGRTVQMSIEPIPPACGDPNLIRQVWVNLLANAVKYTSTRDVAEIKIGSRPEGGECTYFVRDNGVGFDMKYAGKLFGVFQRLHGLGEFEGTGVGLALVQRILHRHGGRVWADAKRDAGATFFFSLPHDQDA